jgi:hypothetical protein
MVDRYVRRFIEERALEENGWGSFVPVEAS